MDFTTLFEMASDLNRKPCAADNYIKHCDVSAEVNVEDENGEPVNVTVYGRHQAAWYGHGREPDEPEDMEVIGIVDTATGEDSEHPFTEHDYDNFKETLMDNFYDRRRDVVGGKNQYNPN